MNFEEQKRVNENDDRGILQLQSAYEPGRNVEI